VRAPRRFESSRSPRSSRESAAEGRLPLLGRGDKFPAPEPFQVSTRSLAARLDSRCDSSPAVSPPDRHAREIDRPSRALFHPHGRQTGSGRPQDAAWMGERPCRGASVESAECVRHGSVAARGARPSAAIWRATGDRCGTMRMKRTRLGADLSRAPRAIGSARRGSCRRCRPRRRAPRRDLNGRAGDLSPRPSRGRRPSARPIRARSADHGLKRRGARTALRAYTPWPGLYTFLDGERIRSRSGGGRGGSARAPARFGLAEGRWSCRGRRVDLRIERLQREAKTSRARSSAGGDASGALRDSAFSRPERAGVRGPGVNLETGTARTKAARHWAGPSNRPHAAPLVGELGRALPASEQDCCGSSFSESCAGNQPR